jgi:hypothetical protein
MEWTGGCLCGDIRYRATEDPEWAGHCHCSMCRKQSGAAYLTGVQFAEEAFEWIQGTLVYYHGLKAARGFCARCGSNLTWEPTAGGFCVFAGSLDRAEDVQPSCHCYTSTKLPWVKLDDDLPQFPEGGPGASWNSV